MYIYIYPSLKDLQSFEPCIESLSAGSLVVLNEYLFMLSSLFNLISAKSVQVSWILLHPFISIEDESCK